MTSPPRGRDQAWRAELRDLITSQLADIQAQLSLSEDGAKPVDLDLSIGRISRVDAMQQQSMALASRSRLVQRQLALGAALSRLDGDAFGECVDCGEPIELGRLRARPESIRCVECSAARA